MRFYLIAGEASGDLHGSNLIKAIKELDPDSEFRVWGGDKMEEAGAELMKHYRDHSFMGFVPVIKNLRTIKANFKEVEADIRSFKPDALILIDYSGFNLRLAKMLQPVDFKIFYYISPQVWAWRSNRVNKIKEYTDQLFSILPFEKEFYKKFDYEVEFVGHPLLDVVANFKEGYTVSRSQFNSENSLDNKPIIAVLPGSRKQEIEAKLPVMLSIANKFPDYQFLIAGTSILDSSVYKKYVQSENIKLLIDQTYPILNFAAAAMVTSGTATMETALFGVPQVVCYKAGKLSYLLVKNLVGDRIKYICMVNLIMDEEVVKELIQDELNSDNLETELSRVLNDEDAIAKIQGIYKELELKLGSKGASERAASKMLEILQT